ncbi:rod shape-determining protein [candidate division CPR3 bacterium 4484_211]|uniref:Cell shape-determining protein MreB n=1 Tax=candidate division CPR3 bacterium 4484_211 TaxID=1968527 RepID=A0A1W9NX61_UNCC3|nr:MAG: rod shape-determining protein [candidate division CPR3 bacterium 4484_211]
MIDLTDKFWSYFTYDLGIDLGTANTLVFVKGKGIVVREPSAVAQHKKTKKVIAIGREAKQMMGKTPVNLVTIKPLRDGVISDFEIAEAMLKFFIHRVHQAPQLFPPKIPRPRVVIGVPYGITEVERKAVVDAVMKGGARKVFLLEEPMAAAIGAGLPIEDASGSMIVDIGGGTSEIAVISLGGIVASRSVRVAGSKMDESIVEWARQKHNLLIGEHTAERAKIMVGRVGNYSKLSKEIAIRGRDLVSGLPKEVKISSGDVAEAIASPVEVILENIRQTMEETPPELLSDLLRSGVVLAGGGSLLAGMDQAIASAIQMPVVRAEDPQTAVVRGCGKVLEDLTLLRRVLLAGPWYV